MPRPFTRYCRCSHLVYIDLHPPQLVVLFVLIYAHEKIFGPIATTRQPNPWSKKHDIEDYTLIFNVFVFCQIFNLFNCRKINNGTITTTRQNKSLTHCVSRVQHFAGHTAKLDFPVRVCVQRGDAGDPGRAGRIRWVRNVRFVVAGMDGLCGAGCSIYPSGVCASPYSKFVQRVALFIFF